MQQFWEDRYRSQEYIYGVEPNHFFKENIDKRKPGSLLLPAEGEGRNACYASTLGWEVDAFDYSREAKNKAMHLAEKVGVTIHYSSQTYLSYQPEKQFDLVGLIYTHSEPEVRKAFNNRLISWLAPEAEIILEGFSKNQLGRPSGGPRKLEMLWSVDEIVEDFKDLAITYCEEIETDLEEGEFHSGSASVIRMIAKNQC